MDLLIGLDLIVSCLPKSSKIKKLKDVLDATSQKH